jgi:hypothetical protein
LFESAALWLQGIRDDDCVWLGFSRRACDDPIDCDTASREGPEKEDPSQKKVVNDFEGVGEKRKVKWKQAEEMVDETGEEEERQDPMQSEDSAAQRIAGPGHYSGTGTHSYSFAVQQPAFGGPWGSHKAADNRWQQLPQPLTATAIAPVPLGADHGKGPKASMSRAPALATGKLQLSP